MIIKSNKIYLWKGKYPAKVLGKYRDRCGEGNRLIGFLFKKVKIELTPVGLDMIIKEEKRQRSMAVLKGYCLTSVQINYACPFFVDIKELTKLRI